MKYTHHLRWALLAATSATGLFATAALAADPAPAPDAPPAAAQSGTEPVEEIIVTGFRQSLASALDAKRKSNLIIESVAAEDMGKMPDQDVAESLQRLSGVQIDRDNGVGTKVRIRGLDQNIVTLNGEYFVTGLEAYANGEGSGGGGNTSTNSLESIPSDLVSGIDVYKTPNSSIVEGGLGGTINLKTRSPLDAPVGLTVGGNFRVFEGEHSKDDFTPIGAVVANYNFNRVFGVTAAFSYSDTNTHSNVYQAQNRGGWQFEPAAGTAQASGNPMATLPVPYISPELGYFTGRDTDRQRISSSLGFAYAPTDSLTFNLDWMHSTYNILTQEVSNKAWFNSNGLGLGIDPSQPYSVDSNGIVRSGTFRVLGAEGDSDVQNVTSNADNIRLGGKWDNGGQVRASFSATYSKATYNSDQAQQDVEYSQYNASQPCATSPTGYCSLPLNPSAPGGSSPTNHGPAYSFTYNNSGDVPSVSYNAPYANLLSNPANAVFKSAWAWNIHANTDVYSARGDVEYSPDYIKAVDVTFTSGFRWADYKLDYALSHFELDKSSAAATPYCSGGTCYGTYGYYMDPGILNFGALNAANGSGPGNNTAGATGTPTTPPVINVGTATSQPGRATLYNNFTGGNGGGAIISQNVDQMNNPVQWLQGLFPNFKGKMVRDPVNSFTVETETRTGYVMADVGGKNDRFHLNMGARLVDTIQTITAGALPANPVYLSDASWDGSNAIANPLSTRTVKEFTDVLPSLNLVLDVTEDQKIRFSSARVMSPVSPYQLGSGAQYNFTRLDNGTKQGFAYTGGSGGNPNLDPYRASQVDLAYEYYFGAQGAVTAGLFYKSIDSFIQTTTTQITVADDFGGTKGAFTAPSNGQGGSIKGIELGAQYAFDFGLGFNANYTYSLSTSSTSTSFVNHLPIPGVSLHAVTGQTYYEKDGFEARLSYSWRSSAVNGDAVGSTFAFSDLRTGKTTTYAVYSRPYGQLDGQLAYQITPEFGVTAEAINITGEAQSTYLQYPNLPFSYNDSGRRFMLGGRFKFN